MLIKTQHFNKKFLTDLSNVVIFSKQYREDLKKNEADLDVGYKKQISQNVKFVGSYTNKKYGDYITDIDVIQFVNWGENVVTRLSQIMQNLDRTNFIFVRFYCGYVEELTIPWVIDGQGSCRFTLSDLDNWIKNIKVYIPLSVYEKIFQIYDNPSLSLRDILDIETLIEPYLSLVWSREDIVNGYKIFGGKRYNLLDTLKKYPKKKVIKYMYRYSLYDELSKTFRNEYCLIDFSLKQKGFKEIKKPDDNIELKAYYQSDTYKILKYIKNYLPDDIRSHDYTQSIKSKIGKYTPLAGKIELIDKCKKYKVIPQREIDNLLTDAKRYAVSNAIYTLDYDELQRIIYKETKDLYNIFRKKILPQNEKLITLYEIRGIEGNIKISKKTIQERLSKGIECVFFPIDVSDMNNLIDVSINLQLDPKLLLKCIYESCEKLNLDIHREIKTILVKSPHGYRIEKDIDGYKLLMKKELIAKSSDIKQLQMIGLIGIKKF